MENANCHIEPPLKSSKFILSMVVSALTVVFFLFFLSDNLTAQQLGTVITYYDSIDSDEEGGRLFFPSFVFAEPVTGEIYFIDGKSRIIISNNDLFPIHTLSKNNGIETPQGLTVDVEGNLYVAQSATTDNPRHRISVYNACFKWDRDIYFEGFEGAKSFVPYRIVIDKKGTMYVAGNYFTGVLFLDKQGRFNGIISPEEEGRKVNITSVTLDKTGRIFLVSEEEGRIYVYDQDRNFIMKFGEKGGSSGKLSRPRAVGVDSRSGRLYVVDYMRHTITVYNEEGKFIYEFGGLGLGEGWFQHPIDLTVDDKGRILVADMFNQRVQVFNSW